MEVVSKIVSSLLVIFIFTAAGGILNYYSVIVCHRPAVTVTTIAGRPAMRKSESRYEIIQ
jgi:hypothetical protein